MQAEQVGHDIYCCCCREDVCLMLGSMSYATLHLMHATLTSWLASTCPSALPLTPSNDLTATAPPALYLAMLGPQAADWGMGRGWSHG